MLGEVPKSAGEFHEDISIPPGKGSQAPGPTMEAEERSEDLCPSTVPTLSPGAL